MWDKSLTEQLTLYAIINQNHFTERSQETQIERDWHRGRQTYHCLTESWCSFPHGSAEDLSATGSATREMLPAVVSQTLAGWSENSTIVLLTCVLVCTWQIASFFLFKCFFFFFLMMIQKKWISPMGQEAELIVSKALKAIFWSTLGLKQEAPASQWKGS